MSKPKFPCCQLYLLLICCFTMCSSADVNTQGIPDGLTTEKPITVNVVDREIVDHVQEILSASEWFGNLQVESENQIVTLRGSTTKLAHKEWAEKISTKTAKVEVVINKITVDNLNAWSLQQLRVEGINVANMLARHIPAFLLSVIVLIFFYVVAIKTATLIRIFVKARVESPMLRNLLGKLAATPFIILGLYLVFNITGLSNLATTLIGGTGLLGLILGIAFRDITENFLASILISIQRPFVIGDTIKVLEYTGMVDAITTRGTVLITLDGNHVQIPNTTIYKQPITNLTANPNIRQSFKIGIDYEAKISQVQNLIMSLLEGHEAVLNDPESLVLVEELGSSSVVIQVYFWVNSVEHSALKVRSSVIRLTKAKLAEAGIGMPDEAREIIFPQGVNVTLNNDPKATPNKKEMGSTPDPIQSEEESAEYDISTKAEGNLESEDKVLIQQSKNAVLGENKTKLV